MKFTKLNDHEHWNTFCQNFWQTTEWQRYAMNARARVDYKNHSLFIGDTGIVPLIQEGDQFTFQGGPTPEFICRPEHKKHVLAEIKRIALENGIKRIHIQGNVRGYLDASTYTCIIDPANPQPTKGHWAAIRKAEKYLTCRVSLDIERFRDDYFRIAGKVTRPPATFDILGRWLTDGYGTLLEARCGDKTAGYTYILHWRDWGYYFMSCVEPEFREYNVSHFLQWRAFELLRQKGIRYYELGEQAQNSLHCQPSDKERNISLFKRGFGGQVIVSPASEYFFDPVFAQATITGRLKNYLEAEYENSAVLPEIGIP